MRTPEVEAAMKRSVTDTELVETKTPPWNRETLASVDRRTLAAEIERLEAELAKSDEAARAAMYAVDERAFLAECAETSVKRAEAAEARVRELEAQYACKRHNGEEAPEAAAQLTDDMLRSCQICGLTVDISKGHCEPTIEFTMQGRTDKKTKKLAELEAQNARLRETLGDEYQRVAPVIADYPVQPWEHLGEGRMRGTWAEDGSPYHFAIPFQLVPAFQAMQRLANLTKRQALADGKAAP